MDLFWKIGLISSILYVTSGDASSGCDSGWETYNNNCYQFMTVKSITWTQAMTECNNLDSSLLRFYDQQTLTWVTNTMKAKYPSTGYWTGLNDNDKDPTVKVGTGRWKWGFYTPTDMTLIQWNASPANDGISLCAGLTLQSTLSDINCASPSGAICYLPGSGSCTLGQIGPDDDGGCYYITNTTDTTQLRNWDDARQFCKTVIQGSDLITVNTANQMNFLKSTLPYQSNTPTIYWVGLKYETTNSQWQWLGGGTPITNIVKWQVEPDNVAGTENCGVLRMTGRFSDRDCNSNAAYICQKPVYNYTPADNVGCGPWMRAGKFCYLFSRGSATWADARNQCLKQNSDLIKVDTFDKKAWLEVQTTDPQFDNLFWSGLNDLQTEGTYVWADGTPLNTSLIVWNREPNDFKGDEDCAVIYDNGESNDIACSWTSPAICEISGTTNCPPNGWIANGNSCYMFTAYDKTTSLFTQSEAQSYCVQQNKIANTTGGLLSISSDDEMAFIMQKVKAITDNQYGWWTSLNDKNAEGYWAYADGTNDPKYMNWSMEPGQLPTDDCGMINWGGNFHERNCSRKVPYICERYAYGQSAGSTLSQGLVAIITSLLVYFHITL